MIREDFCLGWRFAADDVGGMQPPAGEYTEVDLPHDWQICHASDLYRDGTGFYRKTFRYALAPRQRVILWFAGAYMDTAVFVNGEQAGEWKHGYTSFWFDITEQLREGENEVLVRCCLKHPNSRWYSGAGLYRRVELWRAPALHLVPDGLYIVPREQADGSWQIDVSAEAGFAGPGAPNWQNASLTLRLLAPNGACLAECRSAADTWEVLPAESWRTGKESELRKAHARFALQAPALWDLDAPNLYRVEAVLETGDGQTDRLSARFGCRTIEAKPEQGLFLNHRHIELQGVCMHHDLGGFGAAFEPDAAARQMKKLRAMGANSIRTGHTPPDPALMELADEMGFLMDVESFDCWRSAKNPYDYARFFDAWQQKDVAAWVRRDRNHPSLLFWSVGNEIYDMHAGPEGQATLRLLMDEVAQHDPARNGIPTFGSNYMPWPNTQRCADIIKAAGYNYGERMYDEHHAAHPDWLIYGSETASVVQSRGVYHFPLSQPLLSDDDEQCSSLGNSRTSWGAKSLDDCLLSEQRYPYTLGQYLWCGFDYIGEPTPYHTRNSYFGMLDTAGFEKDAFYVCQAAWQSAETQPMVHLFPYWDFNPGQRIDLCACSNACSVELWLNGRSLGRRTLDPAKGRTAAWQALYEPGTLRAVAYNAAGQPVAEDERRSFGESAALCMHSDRTEFSGDGRQLAFITISAQDAAGVPVANANDRVHITVHGAGVLAMLDNGDSTDPEEYQTSARRLFSGLLLAAVAGNGQTGEITVEASAPGLCPAKLTLQATAFAGPVRRRLPPLPSAANLEEVPVRKLELHADNTLLDQAHSAARITAVRRPASATYTDIEWQLTDDRGVPAANAAMQPQGDELLVQALGDGPLRVRALARNGRRAPQVISQLELKVEGFGQLHTDPYAFVPASRYEKSFGEIGNGNERGISTSRTGKSWVSYANLDFGPDGADEVTVEVFSLDGEPTPIRFWSGEPYAPGSEMLGERIYHQPKMWNVYQPQTFTLEKRLRGLGGFGIELGVKVHIKGFAFTRRSRAWDTLPAAACDTAYGDSFTREEKRILGIGNNVSLVFERMDFGAKGCRGIRICGRSALPANTVHLLFSASEKAPAERRSVEFGPQPTWGWQEFSFEPVAGPRQVTFLFLPGTQFDFDSFQFI